MEIRRVSPPDAEYDVDVELDEDGQVVWIRVRSHGGSINGTVLRQIPLKRWVKTSEPRQ